MADNIPLINRPQAPAGSPSSPQAGVFAQPHDYGSAAPAGNSEFEGLMRGLGALNPVLDQMHQTNLQALHAKSIQDQQQAAAEAEARGAREAAPLAVLTGQQEPSELDKPWAHGGYFNKAYSVTLAHRTAMQIKADAIKEWDDNKNDAAWVAQAPQWIASIRQKALAGITNPQATAVIGEHLTALEGMLVGEQEKSRMMANDASVKASLEVVARNAIAGVSTPDEAQFAFQVLKGQLGNQAAPAAVVDSFARNIIGKSTRMGGSPELIETLMTPDKDGRTILDGHPELQQHVEVARKQALEMRQKAVDAAAFPINSELALQRETAIKTGEGLDGYGADWIRSHAGPHSLYKTPSEMSSALGQWFDAKRHFEAGKAGIALAQGGSLFQASGEVNNKTLDAMFGPTMNRLVQAAQRGDTQTGATLAIQMMQALSTTGTNKVWDQLKGLTDTLATNMPSAEGPSAKFLIAASLYKAMDGNSLFIKGYFSDDVARVLRTFNNAEPGGDVAAAYKAAYEAIDPKAIERERLFTEGPEFKKLLASKLGKLVGGVGIVGEYVPLLGSWFRPEDHPEVAAGVKDAASEWLRGNPQATDKDVIQFGKDWVTRSFAYDKTTGHAVKVPQEVGGAAASGAISAYSKAVIEAIGAANPNGADYVPVLSQQGSTGTYRVTLTENGLPRKDLGTIDLGYLMKWHTAQTRLNDFDRKALGTLQDSLKSGKPLPEMDPALIAKADAWGVLPDGAMPALKKREQDRLTAAMRASRTLTAFGFGDYNEMPLQPAPKAGALVDNRITSRVVQEFMAGSFNPRDLDRPTPPSLQALTAALITAGEGVALKPYTDPNTAAGTNIGMGYNLKANAATVDADLKAAGVDPDAIPAVKAGKAALTVEQSKQLLKAVIPRYEKQAKDAAEGTLPGLWDRMTNQQKAVMVDIGYQTGDPAQFGKAWAALAKGDAAGFQAATKVFYRKEPGGPQIEDKTRGGHRAAFLAGQGVFQARVQQLGGIPSNALQALSTQQ